jgi:hypothetical protein
MSFVKNADISVVPRLLLNAVVQFGIAGLGITIVCILRKEKFSDFGLVKKNIGKAIMGTVISFIPSICYILASGDFNGYQPFNILITNDVLLRGFPVSILGMALIVIVWGFFEGFNYVVICEKINRSYPSNNQWIDYGAISCAIVCILFHPLSISFLGIFEIITTFIAIYGMFMAIIIPPAKHEKSVTAVILIAAVLSSALYWIPGLNQISPGMAIIICTIAAATAGAVIHPVEEEDAA